jgi:hypothetical protein
VLDITIKDAYLTDVAIANGHNLHSIITESFQKYADLKEKLRKNEETENGLYYTPIATHSGYYPKHITRQLKLRNLRSTMYILMQNGVVLDTCRIFTKFLAEQ